MECNIEGLKVSSLEKKEGKFSTIYKISKLSYAHHDNFQEIYCSCLYANNVRGWYKSLNTSQNFSVVKGVVNFVVYDSRDSSETKNNVFEVSLSKDNFCSLHLPSNLWYSFGEMNGDEAYIINCLPLVYDSIRSESLSIDSNLIPYLWKKHGK
jgi:dTDP-4-dehydrorhamnose 3,5-epimerase